MRARYTAGAGGGVPRRPSMAEHPAPCGPRLPRRAAPRPIPCHGIRDVTAFAGSAGTGITTCPHRLCPAPRRQSPHLDPCAVPAAALRHCAQAAGTVAAARPWPAATKHRIRGRHPAPWPKDGQGILASIRALGQGRAAAARGRPRRPCRCGRRPRHAFRRRSATPGIDATPPLPGDADGMAAADPAASVGPGRPPPSVRPGATQARRRHDHPGPETQGKERDASLAPPGPEKPKKAGRTVPCCPGGRTRPVLFKDAAPRNPPLPQGSRPGIRPLLPPGKDRNHEQEGTRMRNRLTRPNLVL
jgi:hypothetical protein